MILKYLKCFCRLCDSNVENMKGFIYRNILKMSNIDDYILLEYKSYVFIRIYICSRGYVGFILFLYYNLG